MTLIKSSTSPSTPTVAAGSSVTFPTRYYDFHPDASLNFQLNRFYNWVGDDKMLAEIREAAPKIRNYAEYTKSFMQLGQRALAENLPLKAAYYFRMAEFFMFAHDPAKKLARAHFLQLVKEYYAIKETDHYLIPYESGKLSAYCFTPAQSKGTIVLFGGFDSYIEEWFPMILCLREAGYEVVAFDGPGQGAALEDYDLVMTHQWEKPVKAVLDYFQLDKVCLMGFSLGGYFAIRAAAFEPRISQVICDDILTDFLEVNLRQTSPLSRKVLKLLLKLRAKGLINSLISRKLKKSLIIKWGIEESKHVLGVQTPYEVLKQASLYCTSKVSGQVRQDVLLMAGAEDHYVPLSQFYAQITSLRNVRSLTARLFTRQKQAQNHCQIGNLGLAAAVIIGWLETLQAEQSQF